MTFLSRVWPPKSFGFLLAGTLALTACAGSEATTASDTGEAVTSATSASAGSEPSVSPTEVSLPLLGGGQLAFGDLAGQDTLLWFWAPW